MQNKDFAIVIINYNTAQLTIGAIETLYRTHRRESFRVVLVDNHSSDGDREILEDYLAHHHFPNLEVVWNSENLGFGGGNNLGARHSESEYLVFLNSDTVLTENILSPLKNAFESNSDLQIVSPLLRLEDGKVQPYLAGDFATLMGLVLRKNGDASRKLGALDAKSPVLLPVDWVSGCALTIRRCQFEKLGGFSDDYFMYFEDQDLCKRSSLLGGKTALLTTASLTHLGGKSIAKTKERYRLYDTSQDIFWRKYHSSLSGLMLKILRVPYRWFSR